MGVESPTENEATEELASLQDTLDSEHIIYVDSLTNEIETVIDEASGLHRYEYVIGEISDYGVSSNKHVHFDLVHEGCPLHCVLLQFRRSSITSDLENGMQVAVKGELSFYTDDNYCSIMVEDVVAVGEGDYQQTYEANKRRLEADGLLDPTTKQSLPDYPRCIGLVTSADSDAREDAVTSIHTRHPGVDLVIHDTTVQGDSAGQSMMQAIGALDSDARIDAIVLTRGGGADKHLRVFNETALCRVIHNTTTPIVVGVGHKADRTLAEEVADDYVMTPTDVGRIIPEYDALTDELTHHHERLATAYTQTVTDQVTSLQQRLDGAYEQHVTSELTDLTTSLEHAHETIKQQKRHEQAQAEAAREQRRQRIALVALAVLVLLLLGYIFLL